MSRLEVEVAVIGGGLGGVLAALRVQELRPGARIGLWEARSLLGGRGRCDVRGVEAAGCGLAYVGRSLLEFVGRTLQPWVRGDDVLQGSVTPCDGVEVWQGSERRYFAADSYWQPQSGLAHLATRVVAEQWQELEARCEAAEPGIVVRKMTAWDRQHPARRALAQWLAPLTWWEDWGQVEARALSQILAEARGPQYLVHWERLATVVQRAASPCTEFFMDHPVRSARWDGSHWVISSPAGEGRCRYLIVALPVPDALSILGPEPLHRVVLQSALRSQPLSAVISAVTLPPDAELAPFILQPSAQTVHLVVREADALPRLISRRWIEFEQSLDAPAVVRAVRQLRRAQHQLLSVYGCSREQLAASEKISLVPFALPRSPLPGPSRVAQQLEHGRWRQHTSHLSFVGDSYGPGYAWDRNLMTSVSLACAELGAQLPC